jgi:protein O-mannosyl-transferase
MIDRRTMKSEWVVPLAIAIVVFIVFSPALHDGFVSLDDRRNFLDNDAYRGLGAAQLRWMWTTTLMGHFIPLSWMTLGLDYVLWGMNPAGYHLTNVVLHAANAVAVYFIARRLLRASNQSELLDTPYRLTLAAAAAALLFALHPLRVESVAWVTERRDVLSCLFLLTSIMAYLRSIDAESRRRTWYWLAVLLFICSVLSKATSMTLPAVLLILDVYPLRRIGAQTGGWSTPAARRVYAEIIPFAAVAVAAALVSVLVLHPPKQLRLLAKLAVSAYSLVFYAWKTIAPFHLSPMYELPAKVDPFSVRFLASYAIVAAAGILAWTVRRTRPGFSAAVLTFVVITLPMLGIVQNGPQIAADRYTYYAAPALTIALAGWLFGRARALIVPAGFVVAVLAVLSVLTSNQTQIWRDSASLWTYVAGVDESSSFAQVGLAMLAYDRGDMDGAVQHYRRAVEIRPLYDEGFNNLGNALAREGKIDEAIEQYRRALAINPNLAEAHNGLGSALVQQGNVAEAIEQYRQALAIKPDYAEAHNNWGAAMARTGDISSAIEHYQRALAFDPAYAAAYDNWGNALVRLGKPALAVVQYEAALRIHPDNADVMRNLGVALAQQGKMADAADQFRRALALNPNDVDLKTYLARAEEASKAAPPR